MEKQVVELLLEEEEDDDLLLYYYYKYKTKRRLPIKELYRPRRIIFTKSEEALSSKKQCLRRKKYSFLNTKHMCFSSTTRGTTRPGQLPSRCLISRVAVSCLGVACELAYIQKHIVK